MWNTGCNVIFNRSDKRLLYIVDGEDPGRTLLVPPGEEATYVGTVVPWADRDDEVTRKAFRVHYYASNKMRGWLYIFQDFRTDTICWADWTSASPYLDGKATGAPFKASYIDIQIGVGLDDEGNLTMPVVEFVKVS